MNSGYPPVYVKPAKLIRKEASTVLCSGRVSGARLMTAVLMLFFCLMLTAFSTQAAIYIFDLAVPVYGDDVPLWYLICERVAAIIALIFVAAPGWAGFGDLCGRLTEGHRSYGSSPEQPGIDLRSLLFPWKRGNYLRSLRAGTVLIIDISTPALILPIGYFCGRFIGWATPRPFDLPVVILVNLSALALAALLMRLVSAFSLAPRLIYEGKIGLFKALVLSAEISRGCGKRMFRLRLSFIGWWLLTAVSCGLVLFWTAPLYGVSRRLLGDEMISGYHPDEDITPDETPAEYKAGGAPSATTEPVKDDAVVTEETPEHAEEIAADQENQSENIITNDNTEKSEQENG